MSAYVIEAWGIAPNKSTVAYTSINFGGETGSELIAKTPTYWRNLPAIGLSKTTSVESKSTIVFFTTAAVAFCRLSTRLPWSVFSCTSFPKTDVTGTATLQVLDLQSQGSTRTTAGTVPNALIRVQGAPPNSLAWFRMSNVDRATDTQQLYTLPDSYFDPSTPWNGNMIYDGYSSIIQGRLLVGYVQPIPVALASVTLAPQTLELEKNASAVVSATVTPAVNSNSTLIWVSSDPSIITATPSADTLSATVQSRKPGYADVSVISVANPTATASITVASDIVRVTDVAVTPTDIKVPLGALPVAYSATISPDNAFDQRVTWAVAPPDVATMSVTDSGAYLTFTSADAATVTVSATANDGGIRGSTTATQVLPVQGVDINPATAQVAANSAEPVVLTAVLKPAAASNKTITWSVDKPDVATLKIADDMASATVTFATPKAAKVVVTATTDDGGYQAVAVVTQVIPATAVTVTPSDKISFSDIHSAPVQLTATVAPSDTTDGKPVWTIAPAEIATVTESGLVTPVAPGNATITATAGNAKATVTVTVDKPILGLGKTAWIGIGVGVGVVILAIIVAILVVALRSNQKP